MEFENNSDDTNIKSKLSLIKRKVRKSTSIDDTSQSTGSESKNTSNFLDMKQACGNTTIKSKLNAFERSESSNVVMRTENVHSNTKSSAAASSSATSAGSRLKMECQSQQPVRTSGASSTSNEDKPTSKIESECNSKIKSNSMTNQNTLSRPPKAISSRTTTNVTTTATNITQQSSIPKKRTQWNVEWSCNQCQRVCIPIRSESRCLW
jgi:hypothetical protein